MASSDVREMHLARQPSRLRREGTHEDEDTLSTPPTMSRAVRSSSAIASARFPSWLVLLMVASGGVCVLGDGLPTTLPVSDTTEIAHKEQDYTGTIPTEFGLLTAATSLDLGYNTLTGTMPTELGLLTATSSFSVVYNSLSGTLPTELGKAVEMSAGFLAYRNSLSGSVPTQLGNWVQLTQSFHLSYWQGLSNLFSSTLPTELGRLSKLTTSFMVQQNKVSGAIPTQLGNLNLMQRQLRLDMNEFSALPSELGRLTGITYGMQLYSNDVCGDVPTGASRQRLARGVLLPLRFVAAGPHVASHSASPAHPITVPPPAELQALSSSVTSYWKVTTGNANLGTVCGWVEDARFPGLGSTTTTSVDYNQQGLTGTIPTEFGLLTEVTSFTLANNELTGTVPTELGLMTSIASGGDNANFLNFNEITGACPTELGQLTSFVEFFELRSNGFTVCKLWSTGHHCRSIHALHSHQDITHSFCPTLKLASTGYNSD